MSTPSVAHRLGHDADTLVGAPITALLEPADAVLLGVSPGPAGDAGTAATKPAGTAGGEAVECTLRAADGSPVPVEALRSDLVEDEGPAGVVLTMRDTGDRRRLENQLRRLAYTDSLTGLANRRLLHDRLSSVLAGRAGGAALVMLDLDDFKIVNDLYGHAFGDDLLLETARRLRMISAEFDDASIARLGGDEFALLLPETTFAEARWVCASLLNRLRQPVAVGVVEVEVGTSIGLVMVDGSRSDVEEVVRDADLALYAAKAAGKNSWVQFEPSMHLELVQRLTLEGELRAALDDEQLELHYQPLVLLGSERISGVEALVRWRHPTRGLVPPDEFLPAAERGPLIHALGTWVLRTACLQLARWSVELGPEAPYEMGVNVSPRQLLAPDFADVVARTLAETGLEPHRLVLEVTETTAMDPALGEDQLSRLRALGVRLSIDDFGTGHSSLSRLGHLPVSTLKIDRSFVDQIPATGEAPLVRAIVAMAHSLGLSIVAEGIETERQRDYLTALGCELGQGFLFSRPLTASGLATLVGPAGPSGPASGALAGAGAANSG